MIYRSGFHKVTHSVYHKNSDHNINDTNPSEFMTLGGLEQAINIESTRMDNFRYTRNL
jgi:hypothetical protein